MKGVEDGQRSLEEKRHLKEHIRNAEQLFMQGDAPDHASIGDTVERSPHVEGPFAPHCPPDFDSEAVDEFEQAVAWEDIERELNQMGERKQEDQGQGR